MRKGEQTVNVRHLNLTVRELAESFTSRKERNYVENGQKLFYFFFHFGERTKHKKKTYYKIGKILAVK